MNISVENLQPPEAGETSLSEMIVMSAITADLFKDRIGSTVFYDAKIGTSWDLTKDTALEFVNVIERKFAKNNKFHGYLPPDKTQLVPKTLLGFVNNDLDFDSTVKTFVDNVCREANLPTRGSLTLGHLVMVHYKTRNDADDIGRFLAVLVGKQDGFDFDSDLQPVDLTSINTSELRHAAMFDLTLFKEMYPDNEGDAYLKFITGKSRSAFLKDAFGCTDYIPNKDSVDQVNTAVRAFLDDPSIPSQRRLLIVEKVTTHLATAAKKNIAVSIRDIQQVINGNLPVGSQKIDGFSDFVNLGGYTISERFQPTRLSALSLKSVDITDPQGVFKCSVNLEAIGYFDSEAGKPIVVDDALQYITLPLTPQASAIIKQILGKKENSNGETSPPLTSS